MGVTTPRSPVQANKDELPQLRELSQAIEEHLANARGTAVLMDGNVRVEIPSSLFDVLVQAVTILRDGGGVAILPVHHEFTTQEAADYLGVSRPFFVKLLEEGQIPFHKVGTHRRVRLSDLEAYRQLRDSQTRELVDELVRQTAELGYYDTDDTDVGK